MIVPIDDHYRPTNATWAHDLGTFSDCLTFDGAKLEKKGKVRYNMAQIASALAVINFLNSLWLLL